MFQLTVSLSDDLKEFIEERTPKHGFDTTDDYIEFLLRMEILRLQRDTVEALIQEGLDSGEPTPMTKEDWTRLRRELEERLTQVKSS
jgi:Arc/MetJ-type ribon-helix-helix transcriptional regulator